MVLYNVNTDLLILEQNSSESVTVDFDREFLSIFFSLVVSCPLLKFQSAS